MGLTESVGDSGDAFELWYRKRTPSTTLVLRAASRQVCDDWVRDVSRLLWKQTLSNRRRRQAELACLGVNDRCSYDLTPSEHNIHDRFVDVSLANKRTYCPLTGRRKRGAYHSNQWGLSAVVILCREGWRRALPK